MARQTISAQALNSLDFSSGRANLLDEIGGESLTGSGFESEESEHDFDGSEIGLPEQHAPAKE